MAQFEVNRYSPTGSQAHAAAMMPTPVPTAGHPGHLTIADYISRSFDHTSSDTPAYTPTAFATAVADAPADDTADHAITDIPAPVAEPAVEPSELPGGAGTPLGRRLVPDAVWRLIEPLLPLAKTRPQGGGRTRVDARMILVAVAEVVTSGCSWRRLPPWCEVAAPTAYKRFEEWCDAGVWQLLLDAVEQPGGIQGMDESTRRWARELARAAMDRAVNRRAGS